MRALGKEEHEVISVLRSSGRWRTASIKEEREPAPRRRGTPPSRAQPGGRMVAQAGGEAEEGGGEGWRRGAERAQGPPGSEETETETEPVAELEERGEG